MKENLNKIRDELASVDTDGSMSRPFIAGWDACMERVKPLVEELDVISRFVYSTDTSISTPEALIAKEALKKFRGEE